MRTGHPKRVAQRTTVPIVAKPHCARAARRRARVDWHCLRPGDRLDGTGYVILGKRGAGGMAEVYEAARHDRAKRVAVKLLAAELQDRDDLVARMLREADALEQLRHPHIVALCDRGVTPQGRPFLVTELLRGRTLRSQLRRFGPMSPAHARRVVLAVLAALGAVHDASLVHCDVKVDNVFIRHDGRVKLLDFGAVERETTAMRSGATVGTPRYMAPEQYGDHALDGRADVYGAGLLLLELSLGGWPFSNAEEAGTTMAELDRGAPPRWLRRAVPRDLLRIVARAAHHEPHRRFSSAAAMARAVSLAAVPCGAPRERTGAAQGGPIWRNIDAA